VPIGRELPRQSLVERSQAISPNRRCVAIEVKLWRHWYWHRITRALDPATASGEAGFIGAAISRGCARPARKSVMAPGISERLRPDDRGKRMSRQLTDKGVPLRWLPPVAFASLGVRAGKPRQIETMRRR
jgi:hypothetical protein